jgi:primosomal protein N' (replication factor Y)
MGSATPEISSAYLAAQGRWRYLALPARILAHREAVRAQMEQISIDQPVRPVSRYHPLEQEAETAELPRVQIVDMRQELKSGNRSIFSAALREALERVLRREQQAILFLNRRGTARWHLLRDCGYTVKCRTVYRSPIIPGLCKSASFESLKLSLLVDLLCHPATTRIMPRTCPTAWDP